MIWFSLFILTWLSLIGSNNVFGFYGYGGYEGLICHPKEPNLDGIEWILSQRRDDYGWGENTHRAIVALAVNDFGRLSKTDEEVQLMEYQLEVELTKALLRNATHPILLSDLALYIHALLATSRNPSDFHGIDLVEILKTSVDTCTTNHANVFALLALCNSRAIGNKDVKSLYNVMKDRPSTRKQKELQAIALKALACAADETEFQDHSQHVKSIASSIAGTQNSDGSFGNVYTTALIMQSLIAAGIQDGWNEDNARNFLLRNRKDINMVSTYYIQLALNAHKIRFLKDLNNFTHAPILGGFPSLPELHRWPPAHFIQYSVRVGESPDVHHTVTIRVPKNATFFDIMRLSAEHSSVFSCSWTLDSNNLPIIYKISGIPNDAEQSYYWRLLQETRNPNNKSSSIKQEVTLSPASITPVRDTHFIYWYRDGFKSISGLNSH